jgi:hypothetical protein
MTKDFTTAKRERKVVEFTLDDETYTFTAPKQAGLVMSVVQTVGVDKASTDSDAVRDLLNWLGDGLPDEQATRLLARLQDPDDDLDLAQINDIARYLISQVSNRPTRRRSGS